MGQIMSIPLQRAGSPLVKPNIQNGWTINGTSFLTETSDATRKLFCKLSRFKNY
ncbi:hypothetical protein HanXRQr2_Chr08g0326101 [Helianthus annuus]|uniref:Uncharacterized protein n=1 Tax=Helianthus annuus TaxID=4232 RepID=A0A9K3ICA4_HELAN|nr:hypothetical protein HanXRQr2_Chr08g0326101 [Helianthus annuus]